MFVLRGFPSVAIALVVLSQLPADLARAGEAVLTLRPGESYRFARESGVVVPDAAPELGEREFFPSTGPSPSFALWNDDAPSDEGSDLRANAIAFQALARSRIAVTRRNDFVLEAGDSAGAVVPAHVSASIRFRGFLALVGTGEAKAKATLKVIDVTTDDPVVIASLDAFEESIEGGLNPTIGVDVGAILPVPNGQALFGLEFETEGEKKLVNDDCDLTIPVLLQRGHRYRLLLELKTKARTGIAGGLADVEFWMKIPGDRIARGLDAAPSLLDSRYWRKSVESAEPHVSLERIDQRNNLGLPRNTVSSFLGEIGDATLSPLLSRDRVEVRSTRLSSPRTIEQIFASIGFPARLTAGQFLDWLPKFAADADELTEDLGVRMTDLSVTIAPDPSEVTAREIEGDLASRRALVRRVLPASSGGDLERVISLVEARIEQARAAGFELGEAALYLEYAKRSYAGGFYRSSYDSLVSAYAELSR